MTAKVIRFDPPAIHPRQLGPKQANELAARAHAAKLLSGTSVRLFEYLLRRARPEKDFAVQVRQQELIHVLHASERSVRYAVRKLEASRLVRVTLGTAGRNPGAASGRTWTTFQLDLREIAGCLGEPPGATWMNHAVHPGESMPREGGKNCPERGQELPRKGARFAPPNVRAREESPLKEVPPTPAAGRPAAGRVADPPPSGQGPPLFESENVKCPHGRTAAQGGCRACGTTRRQAHAERARAELQADTQRRIQEQLEQRAQRARAQQAAPDPKPYAAQIRAALRNPTTAQEDQP